MNAYKSLGFVALAASALIAGQAFATACPAGTQGSPVCIATSGGDGPNTSLQDELDALTTNGQDINVYKDQASPSAYWGLGASGSSENALMFEVAGNAGTNTFGIFDPSNPSNYLMLFGGPADSGYSTSLTHFGNTLKATYFDADGNVMGQASMTLASNTFGYYLGANGTTPTFFSAPSLNGGNHQMAAFQGNERTMLSFGGHSGLFDPGEYILAWEDMALGSSDRDYNDFVVMVESVHPVPEPAVLGTFGLGVLLIGGFVALRRRSST